jgi:hypothetical protein
VIAWLVGASVRAEMRPQNPAQNPAGADWVMGLRHAGPLEFGMSLDDVRRILGDAQASLTRDGLAQPVKARCAYLTSSAVPPAMTLMFSGGTLSRIDVNRPGPRTEAGVQVGDAETAVTQVYGSRINVVAHPYLDEGDGHYLMYERSIPTEHDFGLIFETRGGRVTAYRVGRRSVVSQIDGCHS